MVDPHQLEAVLAMTERSERSQLMSPVLPKPTEAQLRLKRSAGVWGLRSRRPARGLARGVSGCCCFCCGSALGVVHELCPVSRLK